jgi:xylulokinase
MLLLGIDLGSSSVKASVIDGETGQCLVSDYYPEDEMQIIAVKTGWAEQDPEIWWKNMKNAILSCVSRLGGRKKAIGAIGISYQMHGLVLTDKNRNVLRPSIIWCDSRAVDYGDRAFNDLGEDYCLSHLLNSPGNFTASKLAWVKENEQALFEKTDKIMLPGDYIAMRMTGETFTTFTGLSEGILWDFISNGIAVKLIDYFGFNSSLFPDTRPSFYVSGTLLNTVASELGLPAGIPVSYRAGDQPNNALSLKVLNPGEVAATAGTSGVIYGVTDEKKFDPLSRVNTFIHVNHTKAAPRLGVLLCINGTGIMNSWLRRNVATGSTYSEMNEMAASINAGSDGLHILPFGNGAERMLGNREPGAIVSGLNFNIHKAAHLMRAAQEGIAFSFRYGLDIMKETGIHAEVIRAGESNMFLSHIFRQTLSDITGTEIQLYNTDGAVGAARGAGIGCGYYMSEKEAFAGLEEVNITVPDKAGKQKSEEAYMQWKELLMAALEN